MKKSYIAFLTLIISVIFSGCSDYLNEESENSITGESLYSTPENIERAVVAIYPYERLLNDWGGESIMGCIMRGDRATDIVLFGGGSDASFSRLSSFTASNPYIAQLWSRYYRIIGRTNEIIYYGNKLGDPAKSSVAEASFWRAYCYYTLFSRFSRVVLITEPTTKDNYTSTPVTPADSADLFKVMYDDCNKAIDGLGLQPSSNEYGRATKGAARHLKALIAAWAKDWNEVVSQVRAIEASGVYSLLPNPKDVFAGANLNNSEAIFVSQWANAAGGGNGDANNGHRFAMTYQTNARNLPGMKGPNGELYTVENGGQSWGRAFPNSYLLSLYSKTDKRYSDYYQLVWKYTSKPDPAQLKTGIVRNIGDTIKGSELKSKPTWTNIMPMTTKYVDIWTKTPDLTASYKDYIIYRLAQTYLLGAEAYIHKANPNQDSARYFYNKTWVRAGNTAVTVDITDKMIMDENARELAFEGHRFEYLKRTGKYYTQVRNYAGDFTTTDTRSIGDRDPAFGPKSSYSNYSGATNTADIRFNVQPQHVNWPIPQAQVDAMGPQNFPQNNGY